MKREGKFGTITHALGPIAKVLDINKGNRMISLTSVAIPDFTNGKWISRKFAQVNKWSI